MGRTVLVVDADTDSRKICRSVLLQSGYSVKEASDGISAWHYASREPPDLISMEQPGSVYGGRALLDSIRANPGIEDVKVLIVSATAPNNDDWLEDYGRGEHYLPKPVDPDSYLAAVQALIGLSDPEEGLLPPAATL
jgi:CheY-like chemotaxis protein